MTLIALRGMYWRRFNRRTRSVRKLRVLLVVMMVEQMRKKMMSGKMDRLEVFIGTY